jgi:hypothetical protein
MNKDKKTDYQDIEDDSAVDDKIIKKTDDMSNGEDDNSDKTVKKEAESVDEDKEVTCKTPK